MKHKTRIWTSETNLWRIKPFLFGGGGRGVQLEKWEKGRNHSITNTWYIT